MKDKLFFLKLRQGDKLPADAKVIQTDGIDNDDQGRFIFVTILLPMEETAESLLSKARSCYINIDYHEGVITPELLERAVLEGQYLHELSRTGKILSSYNTKSSNFISISWVLEEGLGLESFAMDFLKSDKQGVKN